jgi:hypothetical protein
MTLKPVAECRYDVLSIGEGRIRTAREFRA